MSEDEPPTTFEVAVHVHVRDEGGASSGRGGRRGPAGRGVGSRDRRRVGPGLTSETGGGETLREIFLVADASPLGLLNSESQRVQIFPFTN